MRFERGIVLSASRESVWNLVADTDRLNREMGLPPIAFHFQPSDSGGSDVSAEAHVAGFTLRYREHPFDWVRPRFHRVRRTFIGGPIAEIVGGVDLQEISQEITHVSVFADIQPRGPMGQLASRAVGMKSISDFISACRRFDEYLRKKAHSPYPRHTARPPADRARLQRGLDRLKLSNANPELADRLAGFVAKMPPEDVVAIRPFALADRWGVSRKALLETCLHAARCGMLELRWRVLCPYCRGGPARAARLSDVTGGVHCESCNIRYDAGFDQHVEVCFQVAPSIRPVKDRTYCIGGPMASPHVIAQWALPPGAKATTEMDLQPGDYQLVSLQAENVIEVRVDANGARDVEASISASGSKARLEPSGEPLIIAPSSIWAYCNNTDHQIVLRLETPVWTADSATAAHVTSIQTFHDLFSSEVLSPGTEIAVRQICVLFSDLKGSTAMYRERGDAPSYRIVRDHFARLKRVIDSQSGAVLKTAGDAVMATFVDPANGLAAALDLQREFAQDPEALTVKLGLHWGPAIAVNANDSLDYFGQTVNLAARLQGQSQGGDIVIAAELAQDPQIDAQLQSPDIRLEKFKASIRGLEQEVEMVRIRLA